MKAGYIAIIGKPNAGKSTLLNSIMQYKLAIVSPKKQTTRKRTLGIFTDDDAQIVFIDTPGILKPKYELHRSMMKFVENSLSEADGALFIIDAKELQKSDEIVNEEIADALRNVSNPIICAINKCDLFAEEPEIIDELIKKASEYIEANE